MHHQHRPLCHSVPSWSPPISASRHSLQSSISPEAAVNVLTWSPQHQWPKWRALSLPEPRSVLTPFRVASVLTDYLVFSDHCAPLHPARRREPDEQPSFPSQYWRPPVRWRCQFSSRCALCAFLPSSSTTLCQQYPLRRTRHLPADMHDHEPPRSPYINDSPSAGMTSPLPPHSPIHLPPQS